MVAIARARPAQIAGAGADWVACVRARCHVAPGRPPAPRHDRAPPASRLPAHITASRAVLHIGDVVLLEAEQSFVDRYKHSGGFFLLLRKVEGSKPPVRPAAADAGGRGRGRQPRSPGGAPHARRWRRQAQPPLTRIAPHTQSPRRAACLRSAWGHRWTDSAWRWLA